MSLMASSLFLIPSLHSPLTPIPHHISLPTFKSSRRPLAGFRPIIFSVANPNTSNSLNEEDDEEEDRILLLLQQLSVSRSSFRYDYPSSQESLALAPDFLSNLPGDLRLDLNDAAFDLANGAVLDECGEEVGELFLNLSRAWEQADTMTSNIITSKLPSLHGYLTSDVKPAIGKRLVSAGRRFEAMGQYGQGELQRIAIAMINTGKLLSAGPVLQTDKTPKKETRTFKFGELQVALTPDKANIGAAIAFAFGKHLNDVTFVGTYEFRFLLWELSQGIQNIPESSFQYANDNALMLSKSLRGFLLVICYSSTLLSAFASVGLLLLGRQLSSDE